MPKTHSNFMMNYSVLNAYPKAIISLAVELDSSKYAILATIFILSEVGLVAFVALDHQWEKDIPSDPTGEFDSLWTFIKVNADVFMWIGIAIVTIQILSLLLAIVLRSLVSSRGEDDDIEGDYGFRSSTREPLLSPYSGQASGSTRGDSDIWSLRMRQKILLKVECNVPLPSDYHKSSLNITLMIMGLSHNLNRFYEVNISGTDLKLILTGQNIDSAIYIMHQMKNFVGAPYESLDLSKLDEEKEIKSPILCKDFAFTTKWVESKDSA
ncbi:Tetraspanin family protein [Perilla frutescens var. hirtella]|nr:Tetraspanin family protein [Perilla frutescens var. hirtella]